MPIRVQCPMCESSFRIADEHAGKRGKCPKCGEPVRVPGATPEDDSERDETYAVVDHGAATRVAPPAPSRASEPTSQRAALMAARVLASEETKPSRTPAQILTAFRGEIEPVKPTLLYRLWVLIVAAAMILLPLIYVGLIALVAYGLFFHAVHNVDILRGGARHARIALLSRNAESLTQFFPARRRGRT
jgi:predicted Zn finger-like uncharacterized protein